MTTRLASVLAALLLLPTWAGAQNPTRFVVAQEGGGHLLHVVVNGNRLVQASVASADLRGGVTGRGLTLSGTELAVRLDSVNPDYEPPDTELYVQMEGAPSSPHAALFDSVRVMMDSMMFAARSSDTTWKHEFFARYAALGARATAAYSSSGRSTAVLAAFGPSTPQFVSASVGELPASVEPLIQARAESLWISALQDRDEDERTARFSFGVREIRIVSSQPTILHVWIQAISSDGDPRGSFYFVYDLDAAAFRRVGFGHPEWSPRSSIVEVRPRLFFRIAADGPLYVLAEYGEAWEDYSGGWAILDAATGRLIARSS